jgi:hypothetical protein
MGAFLAKWAKNGRVLYSVHKFRLRIWSFYTKSVDTQSSQYYNAIVLNRKEINMYSSSIVVIISIISVLLVGRLEMDGFML